MSPTIRRAVCSSRLTLLTSPDSPWGGLGRAHVISRRGGVFVFFQYSRSDLNIIFVSIYLLYQLSIVSKKLKQVVTLSFSVH